MWKLWPGTALLRVVAVVVLAIPLVRPGSATAGGNHQTFDLGNFAFESGVTLLNAKLSYVTHGTLNADKTNAIVVPSFYSGDHHGNDAIIGLGKALDPTKYFVIATDMFADGLSSSPSNTPPPLNGPNFPEVSTRDNVKAAYRLVTERFGIRHLKAWPGFRWGPSRRSSGR